MNPVRAEIVKHPGEYRWSSYLTNVHGEHSELITPHLLYLNLGKTDEQRQCTYKELIRVELVPEEIDRIRKATNGNFSLGCNRFQEEVREMVGRRVIPGKAGRPGKKIQCQ